ncbi:centrosomal protein of 78 kDa isoform X1 [Tachysurus vachellii]|uniref:centrosomal protein of 78 kDa isoform X1 n=1 Tax=Tachysurus vachellii TaxID=175792 RepID=UPI00296B4921|nr:centrosomal protein of 78 kDa isoform X1 [Tachysurus vachellii]
MQGSAQTRRRAAQDFEACYESLCATQGSAPVAAVRLGLSHGVLDFNGDAISYPDWLPILSALAINKQLHHVGVKSYHLTSLGSQGSYKTSIRKKTPVVHSKNMTFQLCKAVQKCLSVSHSLKTLQLHRLPLRERDLDTLTKGLSKCVSLEHLSLAHCPIADDGLETICQSVKYSTTIKTVDFTACNITWRGAEHLANIIKHQAMRRHTTAWAETLRYRKAEFEAMGGLRRITLNENILIGDRGVTSLAQELTEDLWVKAVDLQRCGISNEGARVLEKMLQSNTTLCVLDIRRNPLLDNELVKSVIKKVLMNNKGQDSQYLWLKPPAKEASYPSGQTTRRSTGRATYRIVKGSRRTSSAPCGAGPPRPGSTGYIPWRTAARAKVQRGLPQSAAVADQSFQNASSIRVTLESESESQSEEIESTPQSVCVQSARENISNRQFRRLQDDYRSLKEQLEECRLRLIEERNARLKATSRVVELELENNRLHNVNQSLSEAHTSHSVLEDEHVLDSIESSFHKFHAFLDLLKDAGLGQLASMAGIEQSDFGVLNRPQLSSTQQRGDGDQVSKQRKDSMAQITNSLQKASRLQSSTSSSAASAVSKNSRNLQSPQDVIPTPAPLHFSLSPSPLDHPDALHLQRRVSPNQSSSNRESGSDKPGGRRRSKSGSSASIQSAISVHSNRSYSYRDDFSEGKLSPALSSRSSSMSRFGSERISERHSEGQRSAVWLAGL